MAYVKRIEADGFLSFSRLRLDLGGALTTVAGPNSIGKSNLALCIELVRDVVGRYAGTAEAGRLAEFETWGFEGASAFRVALALEFDLEWERDLVADFVHASAAFSGGEQADPGSVAKHLKPEQIDELMDARLDAASLRPLHSGVLHVFFDATYDRAWSGAWEFGYGDRTWHIMLFGANEGYLCAGPAQPRPAHISERVAGLAEPLFGRPIAIPAAADHENGDSRPVPPQPPSNEAALEALSVIEFTTALPKQGQAVSFRVSSSAGRSQEERVPGLRRLTGALGFDDANGRDVGFASVLAEILRRTIVLTDNRRVSFTRDFDPAQLREPVEMRDGGETAALLHVLKSGDAAQRARFERIRALFTQLTGVQVDVRFRPSGSGSTVTIEPVILSPHGDRPVERSGTGRQEALVLAVLLTGPPGRLLVLDEPAANLEGVGQRRLLGALRGAGQCLLITHSADLVPIHHDGDIYNLVRLGPGDDGAVPRRLSALTPEQESRLVKAFAFADMRALLFADMVVLTEGETEAAVLEHWWSDLDEADLPPWETVNIHMVSVGGDSGFGTFVDCLERFAIPWAIIADGPALARSSGLATQLNRFGLRPSDLPKNGEDFAACKEAWRRYGVFTLAEQFGAGGSKGGEIEAYLKGLNPELYEDAERELGKSKPRLAAYFAARQPPPAEVVALYRSLVTHFGLRRDRPLPASAPPGGFSTSVRLSQLAVPRLPIDPAVLAEQAGGKLADFPQLARKLPPSRLRRAATVTTSQPPAPLLYWLWVASQAEFAGAQPAGLCLAAVEIMLTLFDQRFPGVVGAWNGRVNKLLPPPGGGDFEHYTNFRATLFELHLAFQLQHKDAVIRIEPDGGPPGCDLTIIWKGAPIAAVEAYAPHKGVQRWYAENFATPWKLLTGQVDAERRSGEVRDVSMTDGALAHALSNVLTDSNFEKQKYKQLASGTLPTVLAVRGYNLNERPEQLMLGAAASADLAAQISKEAWSRLPDCCLGLLLCLTADIPGTSPPSIFIPHPDREPNGSLNDYFSAVGIVL